MSCAATPYEVVIAGAGPAGCAAAITLHQAGLRVCLVDDASASARPKAGEALPGAAHRLLHRLGIAGIKDLLAPPDYTACVANASCWGNDYWTYQDALRNPEGGGWHLNRTAFDAALRQRALEAGVPLYQARISQLTPPGAGSPSASYWLELRAADGQPAPSLQASWLIDATGRAAFVSRRLQGGRYKLDNQMAAVAWVTTAPHDLDQATRIKSGPAGWWYTARLPDGQRVISFHGLPATVAEYVRRPTDFLAQFNEAALLPQPVAVTPALNVKALDASVGHARQAATAGLLCVGDAALAFDPLSSQGIFFALYSGITAGVTLARCVATPALESTYLSDYQTQVSRILVTNQQTRRYFYANECRYRHEAYWRACATSFT